MKKFIAGFLSCAMLMSSVTVFGESITKNIDAVFGQVKLVVNGTAVDKETLLYGGTTYVPLRAAAEVLGMEVDWDGNTNTASLTNNETIPTPVITPTPEPKEESPTTIESKAETPVTVDQFEYTLNILEPNSIGTIYVETAYTNKSSYSVVGFNITYLDKGTNEKRYLSCYDTVLSNEKSSKFDTFGPESGKSSDIEILVTRITILNENGDKVWIDYDHKLKTYDILGKW